MENIKRYDLHKNDYSKLHFEVNEANTYFQKNRKHASIPHRHSFYQVIWFKSSGSHYIDYEVVEHPENTLFFLNQNQIHHFCPDSANEGYLFHFNSLFLDRYSKDSTERFSASIFNEIGNAYVQLSEADAKKMSLITSYIRSELSAQDPYYREQVFHHFQIILFQIERLRNREIHLDFKSHPDYKLAVAFKRLIVERINSFYGIEDYASKLGTNKKMLTRASKKYLLDTPANVIKNSKLLEAKRQLSNRGSSIKEIAYGLGFEDPTYFTKYFKKGTGFTPKAFQKAYL